MIRSVPLRALAALATFSLSACSTISYYAHLAHGEASLLAARRPIERLVADPSTDPHLRARLDLARQARAFASDRLGLPRNGSYTDYADLHRPYAVWNVFAAPEFSLDPVQHCFLLVGCVAYRGYYDRADADAEAACLRAQGNDTWVGGVSAYSTLGWFDDPILNTMLRWDDDELVGTIFHELAHQRVYVKGDTEFNESFATFVQREGLREWHAARGLPPVDASRERQSEEFDALVLAARERLRQLYAQPLASDVLRARKREEIERLRSDYRELRATKWHGDATYDGWIESEINNAKLLPFGLYNRLVSAFERLFDDRGKDWGVFYGAVGELGRMTQARRAERLGRLQSGL
ncbi:MAG TPA: aminopeptidase [Rudaea sp.]